MKPTALFLPALLMTVIPLRAQTDSAGFSTTQWETDELTVTAQRDGLLSKQYATGFQVALPDTLLQSGTGWSGLVARLPGATLREYGGIAGFQSLSARGTSAGQNVVVLDGMILNDGLSGSVNLAMIAPDQLSGASFRSGGFSVDAAAGAFGSTMVLNSGLTPDESWSFRVVTGSWNTRGTGVGGSLRTGPVAWSGRLYRETTDGNYRIQNNGLLAERVHNEATAWRGQVSATWNPGPSTVTSSFLFHQGTQNIPGPVFWGTAIPADARLITRDLTWIPTMTHPADGALIRLSALLRSTSYQYTDPAIPTGESSWKDTEQSVRLDWLPVDGQWSAGMYLRNQHGLADLWKGRPARLDDRRRGIAVFSGWSGSWLKLSGRLESVTGFNPVSTGAVTVFRQTGSLHTQLSLVRNARYPTLTDFQYQTAGQPLRLETYLGLEPEIRWSHAGIQVVTRGFWYRIRNKLAGIPQNAVRWTVINAGAVNGVGAESLVSWTTGNAGLWCRADWQSIRLADQDDPRLNNRFLVYTPPVTLGAGGHYGRNGITATSDFQWIAPRFFSVENLASDRLPAVGLWNASLQWKTAIGTSQLAIAARVYNLTDAAYEWVVSYPMPGRTVRAELEVLW